MLVLAAGGLTLDTPSPDALCPPLERTRSAVESRLGAVELEGTWRATYVLVHRTEGDVVLLQLRDPKNELRLEREYSANADTCATLAQVIALVLERYFLRPDAPSEAARADTKEATVTVSSPTDSAPIEGRVTLEPPPFGTMLTKRVQRSRFAGAAGLWSSNAWVAPTIGFSYRSTDTWSVGLCAGYDLLDHERPIVEGWGSTRRLPFALQGTHPLTQWGALRLSMGAEILGLYERAQTAGLGENRSGGRVVPGLAVRVASEIAPGGSGTRPFVDLAAGMLLERLSRPFQVDGQPVFALPIFVLGVHFGIRTIL